MWSAVFGWSGNDTRACVACGNPNGVAITQPRVGAAAPTLGRPEIKSTLKETSAKVGSPSFRRNELKVARHFSAGKLQEEAGVL